MHDFYPARNLPWTNATVAESVADQLVRADQGSRVCLRHLQQIEALLDEQWTEDPPAWLLEACEHAQSAIVGALLVRSSMAAASAAAATATP